MLCEKPVFLARGTRHGVGSQAGCGGGEVAGTRGWEEHPSKGRVRERSSWCCVTTTKVPASPLSCTCVEQNQRSPAKSLKPKLPKPPLKWQTDYWVGRVRAKVLKMEVRLKPSPTEETKLVGLICNLIICLNKTKVSILRRSEQNPESKSKMFKIQWAKDTFQNHVTYNEQKNPKTQQNPPNWSILKGIKSQS